MTHYRKRLRVGTSFDRKSLRTRGKIETESRHQNEPERLSARIAYLLESVPEIRIASKFAAFVSFLVLLATAYQIIVEIDNRKLEREIWRQSQITNAWSNLLRPVGGNTGKGDALNFLLSQNINMYHVDLSCRAVGVWEEECINPAIFSGVDFTTLTMDQTYNVFGLMFAGNSLIDTKPNNDPLVMTAIKFNSAEGERWDLSVPTSESLDKTLNQDSLDVYRHSFSFAGVFYDAYGLKQCNACNLTNAKIEGKLILESSNSLISGVKSLLPYQRLSVWSHHAHRAEINNPPLLLRTMENGVPVLAELEYQHINWCETLENKDLKCGINYEQATLGFPKDFQENVKLFTSALTHNNFVLNHQTFNAQITRPADCDKYTQLEVVELIAQGYDECSSDKN